MSASSQDSVGLGNQANSVARLLRRGGGGKDQLPREPQPLLQNVLALTVALTVALTAAGLRVHTLRAAVGWTAGKKMPRPHRSASMIEMPDGRLAVVGGGAQPVFAGRSGRKVLFQVSFHRLQEPSTTFSGGFMRVPSSTVAVMNEAPLAWLGQLPGVAAVVRVECCAGRLLRPSDRAVGGAARARPCSGELRRLLCL